MSEIHQSPFEELLKSSTGKAKVATLQWPAQFLWFVKFFKLFLLLKLYQFSECITT